MHNIEKNIPIPARPKSKSLTDTMRRLEVGDSFLRNDKVSEAMPYIAAKRLGIKIVVRQTADGKRIWRVE